ncbi:hypothetical protein MMC17_003295 [Xylographa soralifera]|nr:hypothetical protein [Xylographa soralifera]
MAPISTKKEQERSILYSSHGISASRFNTDEILRHPVLTLEFLERNQENEKKKESAPVQQKNTHPIKHSGPAKVSRVSGESKPQPEATWSDSSNTPNADSAYGPAPKDDVLILPDDFEMLSTTKSRCSDPLDELCKALRVPYTVLDVSSGPRQAQGPTTKRIYRRDEIGDYLDPTLQNFDKATSEEYGKDYKVSIEKVGPDNRSPARIFWDGYYPLILAVAGLAGIFLFACLTGCLDVFCVGSIKSRFRKKVMKAKARAEKRREEAIRPGLIGADIELENVNQV